MSIRSIRVKKTKAYVTFTCDANISSLCESGDTVVIDEKDTYDKGDAYSAIARENRRWRYIREDKFGEYKYDDSIVCGMCMLACDGAEMKLYRTLSKNRGFLRRLFGG